MTAITSADIAYMQRAIELAEQARFSAKPNPHVGCVIVNEHQIVGEGYTQPPGGGHAEVQALRQAGERARGATAYVTLEPCCHHGRTGPCTEALINAGIKRVVAAIEDPFPGVSGSGFEALTSAGIEVSIGLLSQSVKQQLRGFLQRMQRGHGWITLKLACSLDGKVALQTGESQWITGPAARSDVQRLRAQSGLIITGVGTVIQDDCLLTVRPQELQLESELAQRAVIHTPVRAVFDPRLRISSGARILGRESSTVVCYDPRLAQTQDANLGTTPVLAIDELRSESGLRHALQLLAEHYPANEILVECGPTLAGAFLTAGLVDELILYQAPILLGHNAKSLVQIDIGQMTQRLNFDLIDSRKLGQDLRLTLTPRR
jgi:diaminohydroxyphosphoribosylaminopyrimidine deaminase/5-amino-6-(5-phosphoribosylamino)uracil reductase